MSDHGKFITFPICWLSAGRDWPETLNKALGYGVTYYLLSQHDTLAVPKHETAALEEEARSAIGISGGTLAAWRQAYSLVSDFAAEFGRQHGPTFSVRLNTPLLFESRDGDGLSERDLRVHCALLSMLGSKGYVRAGWQPLAYRAAGYLRRPTNAPLLSRHQVDRALRELVGRGLWQCYAYTGRGAHAGVRYWSNRLNLEQLVAAVHRSKKTADAYAKQQAEAAKIAAKLAHA